MALPLQKAREIVFQLFYAIEEGKSDPTAVVSLLSSELLIGKKHLLMALERVKAIQAKKDELEAAISDCLLDYVFGRIQSVERMILCLGTFELLFDPSLPPKIVIAEAVRLAQKFSTPSAVYFVNGILDVIYKKSRGIEVDIGELQRSAVALFNDEEEHAALALELDAERAS